ncbi:MAG: Amuc_1101 family PilM-like pilus complex protein [Verrucomicrobiales bacterium]
MAEPKSFVALNIGSQRVSIAVFSATPEGGLLLKRYDAAELIADPVADTSRIPQVTVAVNELAEKMGVRKRPVRYAISGQSVFTRFVKLPPLTEEKVDQIVEFEAQQNVPFPINEVVWDYQLLGSPDSPEVEVVLVAIKSDSLDDLNDGVAASSMTTETVDVAPMALYNAFRYNFSDIHEPSLLVDIGARTTNLIYVEGTRAFTRSIPVGGSTVTGAIAKEFEISFADAEEKKIEHGFVALGGAYADHENPEIAAMSKVIRNTLTRLHAEIVRTNNFYRSQQGGNVPSRIFLCGASSSMPFIRDFFMEKLNLPVEFFNPLRNVVVAPEADADRLSHEAHMVGELVGLGLRGLSSCPMEIDLVPEKVQRARALTARKPAFITAGVCVVALLGAAGFFLDRVGTLTELEVAHLADEVAGLEKFDDQIKALEQEQAQVDAKTEPFTEAVFGRIFWVSLLRDINSNYSTDLLWLTALEPYSNGQPVTKGLFSQGRVAVAGSGEKQEDGEEEDRAGYIDEIVVAGLYRENPASSQVVVEFVQRLTESDYFDIRGVDPAEILEVDTGIPGAKWAWPFKIRLPFPEGTRIPYKK